MTAIWLNQGMVMATQPDFTDEGADGVIVDNDTGTVAADTEQDNDALAETGELAASGEDEQDEIGWGGTTVAGEDEPEGVRNLRKRLREREEELKALKGGPKVDDVGERPTLEACDFDDDRFERELAEYIGRKRTAEERESQANAVRERQAARWNDQRRDLDDGFADLRVPGKDAARAAVEEAFTGEAFAYLVKAAGKKAAPYLYALGNSAEKRAELKALVDEGSWAEFIATAAIQSNEVTMQRRKPTTTPEQQHRGTSGGGAHNSDAKLARLEAAAAKPGADRTELIAYKRQLRDRQRG